MDSARSTPACVSIASTAASFAASAPVCDEAARAPARERPDFTTITGLRLVMREAVARKRRGSPKFSTYMRITRTGVVLPLLEQVGARHIGTVADGNELRDADAEFARVVEHAEAEGPRLRHERRMAERRHDRREGRVHGHGDGIDDAHAVRSHEAHAVASHGGHDVLLERHPVASHLAKAGRDDHEPLHTRGAARLDGLQHAVTRDDDHCEVHRFGDRPDGGIGAHRTHRRRVRMHRIGATGEPEVDQVGEHLPSHLPGRGVAPTTAIVRGARIACSVAAPGRCGGSCDSIHAAAGAACRGTRSA